MNSTESTIASAARGSLAQRRTRGQQDHHATHVHPAHAHGNDPAHNAAHPPGHDAVHGHRGEAGAAAPGSTHRAQPRDAQDAAHARGQASAHAGHGHRPTPVPGAAAAADAATASAHAASHAAHGHGAGGSLNRVALSATLHCLSGCAIGEIAGMVIGTALGFGNLETIALAISLAFVSGYALTMLPLLRAGVELRSALKLALAADTASIAIMEIVDNLVMLVIPGAMDAPLDSALFWGSLALALAVAAAAAYPVVRWLIARGRGHAVVHAYHGHH